MFSSEFNISETVLQYSNFEDTKVITSLNAQVMENLLRQSKYPEQKRKFIVQGLRNGFDLGYRGSPNVKLQAPNLRLRVGSPTVLWNKVMKEVKLK